MCVPGHEPDLSLAKSLMSQTRLVPGDPNERGYPNQLRISAALFRRLVTVFQIPPTVLNAAFNPSFISRDCGLGLFGTGESFELFYPCIITGDRCFVYGRSLGAGIGFVHI